MAMVERPAVERSTVHRIWRALLVVAVLAIAVACYVWPVVAIVIGVLLVVFLIARLLYRGHDRYVPHLYARDITSYDNEYRDFIRTTIAELRKHKIPGHPLLWEASQLPDVRSDTENELLLDLGVWIGWSTRLISDASGRAVYGFDTFEGLVEDWQLEDQVIKRGSFAISDPVAQMFIRDTGVSFEDGLPAALGRRVQFIKGSTYDTLAPFLAERPDAPIRLFHMDLDTYESCLHALETCKEHFIEGSILVFDEYLVTNGEIKAFYEFQKRYGLQWRYRSWGLEVMEMNTEMIPAAWKRMLYHMVGIPIYWLVGEGRFASAFYRRPFWRFWFGAPISDMLFLLSTSGPRKSVSLEVTGVGALQPRS